ncbi:MAG: hypothetical protein D6690_12390 [Nitrospirae bacterium]|nr:MAG: hypothetical protein D6690_12390 [Nitrospirota bacterium]
MRNRPITRVVASALAIWLIVGQPLMVQADVNQSLQDLFTNWGLVNVTPGGAYQSQQRGYFTGGRYSLRTYNDPMAVLNFAAPKFGVGCSGIDIYLGAFSYGKLSRYVDLLTQLGTGVVLGFAFQLAMKELCETCSDVLNKIESAARMLNSMGRVNPCEAGKRIGQFLGDDVKNNFQGTMRKIETTWEGFLETAGSIGDVFENRDTRKNQTRADALGDLGGTEDDPRGNLVWMVLKQVGLDDDTARMIMSAVGTVVVDEDGEVVQYPPVLKFEDLYDAEAGDQVRIYKCDDGYGQFQCLRPLEEMVTNLDGFRVRTFTIMDGIHTAVRSGVALTATQQDFINQVPVAVYRMLADTTGPPERGADLIQKSSALIAAQLCKRWLEWAVYYTINRVNRAKDIRRAYAADLTQWREQARGVLDDASREVIRQAQLVEAYTVLTQEMRLQNQEHQSRTKKEEARR